MVQDGRKLIPFGISTLSGAVVGVVILLAVNAALLRVPDAPQSAPSKPAQAPNSPTTGPVEPDYKALMERNLFRAKLQVEIPKPKSEKEIEEEALTATVKPMALKGVVLGLHKKDSYAVIDLGGQKGVWAYEEGEVVEKGLALKEIHKDSIKLEKGEFAVILKLFTPVYQRTAGTQPIATPDTLRPQKGAAGKIDLSKEIKGIRKEGGVTLIPKSLADKLKADNNMVMSSVAVKASDNGLKVVAVDQGSIAQKIGIAPDDTLQEINGHKLNASGDMNKLYDELKNATDFEVTVLRRGQQETLRYEIR
jgi:type II secretory pathway component PulC